MYLALICLLFLNLYISKKNIGDKYKFCSIKFLGIRFLLPLITYCLLAFMVQTKVIIILALIGVLTTMIDVRCQHLKTEKDKKIRKYNKLVIEVNFHLIIIYILFHLIIIYTLFSILGEHI